MSTMPIAETPFTAETAGSAWGPPPSPFPALASSELVEAQAARHPARTALRGPAGAMSYAALDAAAEAVAARLEEEGAGSGVLVAVCAEPSPEAVAAILGIWKIGGVWVPLHPDQPPRRFARQLAATGSRWCLADDRVSAAFDFGGVERLPIRPSAAGRPRRRAAPRPEAAAYGIFTSGSTGEPKLAILRHDGLVNYTMFVWQDLLGGEEGLRFATPSSLAADLGHTCVFPALASGGTLEIAGPDVVRDPALFSAFVRERAIDVLKIVPSHFAAIGAEAAPRRLLVFGGEALSPELARASASRGCAVVNHYGPTETTVGALVHRFDPRDPDEGETVPIGRPIANVRASVMDGSAPAAPGAEGELWIGGAGVAEGYFGKPDETALRFVPDPSVAGARVYRTGDRVRTLPGGAIQFLGRSDDQVKIRGHRVETGEVAAALRRHPAVDRVAVGVRRSGTGVDLVAAAVPRAGEPLSESDLRAFAAGELPAPWIPGRIAVVTELPLAASGKVDLARLAEPEAPAPGRAGGPVERWIAGIFGEILGIAPPGVDENFFALGGHSLAAMRVMARIRREIPAAPPLPAIFRNPTAAGLAAAVSRACGSDAAADPPPSTERAS